MILAVILTGTQRQGHISMDTSAGTATVTSSNQPLERIFQTAEKVSLMCRYPYMDPEKPSFIHLSSNETPVMKIIATVN